eukprot:8470747-Karenia_brevis.AAC.1
MPHCGYSDEVVEEMYAKLSELLTAERQSGSCIILAGDWNAEVPSNHNPESIHSVGAYGNPVGNARGLWFLSWALSQRLCIVNTKFKKRWGRLWTHAQNGRQRILDYFCVENNRMHEVVDAGVCKALNMGSDHRALFMKMKIGKGWQPTSVDAYKQKLDDTIEHLKLEMGLSKLDESIDEQVKTLEKLIIETASLCKAADKSLRKKFTLDADTKAMLEERRSLSTAVEDRERRAKLSKNIQSNLRKAMREHKRDQIDDRLKEFKNLKGIANIRGNGKSQMLQSVYDSTGCLREGRQEIVDVFADFYAELYSS